MNKNALVTCLIVASFLNAADAMAASVQSSEPYHSASGRRAHPRHGFLESKVHHPVNSASGNRAYAHPPFRQAMVKSGAEHGLRIAPAQPFIVAIDAGHGGKDTGAIGYNGTLEKDVVYAIARRLERLIGAEPGMRPVMVRKGDVFIALWRRAEIARRAGADLFISIHADAHTNDAAKGSSVYTLSPRRMEANDFAENTLEARRAARKVLGELRKKQRLHYRHVQRARFAVLKSPDVPSMLIETGFVSNPEEERNLASQPYQEKVARSIFNGIRAYFRAAGTVRWKAVGAKPVMVASRQ